MHPWPAPSVETQKKPPQGSLAGAFRRGTEDRLPQSPAVKTVPEASHATRTLGAGQRGTGLLDQASRDSV